MTLLEKDSRITKRALLPSLRIIVPLWVIFFLFCSSLLFVFVPSVKNHLINQKKLTIRELTESTWSLLAEYQQRIQSGELSISRAQSRAIERIRGLRYGPQGKDYFWINDLRPRMIMHPYFPELEGKDLSGFTDPDGKKLFVAFVHMVQRNGAGYVDYLWQWKDDPARIAPKTSYVKLFEPWGWVIGTGIYTGDVEREISTLLEDIYKVLAGLLILVLALSLYISWQAINTENKRDRAQSSLRESEEKYRLLAENANDLIWTTDADLRPTYLSPSVHRIRGMTPEEALRQPLKENLTPESFRKVMAVFKDALDKEAQGEPVSGPIVLETESRRKDGSTVWLENSISAFRDENGKLIGVLGIGRDLTERKKVEARLRESETQLQQAQKMEAIGTLAGGIAHDFNNILAPLVGFTEMLMQDLPEDHPFQANARVMLDSALRARDLVKQILTFSRKMESEIKPTRIQQIVKESIKLLRSSIPANIDIHERIDPDCGPVNVDSTKLHQVIMNLATNAYHAMEESGGRLTITLDAVRVQETEPAFIKLLPGNYACLCVIDTGVGINAEDMNKIFDPYYTTKEIGKGTGLGLSVVHGIIEEFGGHIEIESAPGQGCRVDIYLPIISMNDEQTFIVTETIPGGTEHILLVDDEAPIIRMEQEILKRLGYQVTTRTSSVEAYEAFKAHPDRYDLVLTDMAMPNMTGAQLAQKIKSIRWDIPIIICTGFRSQMTDEKCRALGIQAYLMKPLVIGELAVALRRVLDAVTSNDN